MRMVRSVGELAADRADMRPPTASMRRSYVGKGWLASTGAMRVWISGEDSKRVSRTWNCWSWGREGIMDGGGRADMVVDILIDYP